MPRNPYYQGPVSDHFDGVRFHNLAGEPETDRTLSQVLRWRRSAPHNPWPRTVPVVPTQPAMAVAGLRITMIGHATVLIQLGGLNLLTDPVWAGARQPGALCRAAPRHGARRGAGRSAADPCRAALAQPL
jgi:hypothetical protein